MIQSKTETITPAIAQKYLSMSAGNRNISKPIVIVYAREMKAGRWKLNGESIKFDEYGTLIDGHHRLHAVIKANTSIQSVVLRNIEAGCFATYDCGRRRSLGQLISIDGTKNYNTTASVVMFVHRLRKGYATKLGGTNALFQLTNAQSMNEYKSDPDGYDNAGAFAVHCYKKNNFVDKSIIGGFYYHLTHDLGYSSNLVSSFFMQLCSYDSCENETINTLRKKLIIDRQSLTRLPRGVIVGMIIKTWNYFIMGRKISVLKYSHEKENNIKLIRSLSVL